MSESENLISENETAVYETFEKKTGAVLSKDDAIKRAEEKAAKAPDPKRGYRIAIVLLGVAVLGELLGILYLMLLNAEKARTITGLRTEVNTLDARLRSVEDYLK